MITYDVKKYKVVNEERAREGGVVGFISFGRLVEQLRLAGEFSDFEEVEKLYISDHGIEYKVNRKV